VVSAVRNTNLALRFALELTALAAVGWWGWDVGGPLLALAAVAAVVAVWGAFVAPKRRFDLAAPIRLAIELAVWLAAGAALYGVGHTALAVAFVVLAVVSGVLNHLWQ
jgi:Protein of unknown function (DUF2568)